MKVKVINIDQNEDASLTTVTLATPIGEFKGTARFNFDKDPLPPSRMMGGRIAEDRAYIAYLTQLRKIKHYESKGVIRAINSLKKSSTELNYLENIVEVINDALLAIDLKRDAYIKDIEDAVRGREMFVRSRTEDKEYKKQKLEELGDAIKALGQNTSKDK